jgi:membrane protein DedA with SNARE-associated domain
VCYIEVMFGRPKLIPEQWQFLASAFSHISQGIILFSLGTIFVPEAVGLPKDFSRVQGIIFLISGFILLIIGVIMSARSKK